MKEFEIAFPIRHTPTEAELSAAAARALGCSPARVAQVRILRRSLDARGDILYRYRVAAAAVGEDPLAEYKLPEYKNVAAAEPVIVVGSGPAGMFAALRLLMEGRKPVILERGVDVHARKTDIAALSTAGRVNPDSNYCFGEGGAGTFSDGKLFTRSNKRGDIREVLHQLVAFGADPSILVDAHPHIGSDRLPLIVENIRQCIVDHGGEYHFGTRVTDLHPVEGAKRTWKVICEGGLCFEAPEVILATGHSSRELYRLFVEKGWALEAKGFALGVRAEHPQSLINRIQYHGRWQPDMPAAEYALVTQAQGRGVFSFCMCPGGILVPSVSAPGEVVLNGMSNSQRNSKWADAGIVCSVEPGDVPDYDKYGVFALLEFQEAVERRMYAFSDSIQAPAQRMMDFCRKSLSAALPATSYHPGAISAPLHELLPDFVYTRLREAFPAFNRQMKGYYTNDALLLACESRTSSPVRIPRDPATLESLSCPGLYPCGEGAGYAGGIVSSAVDGILAALAATRHSH